MITQEMIKELLIYNPDTGIFLWKIASVGRIKMLGVAGSKHNQGYIVITIKGKAYLAHRLAWLYVYGEIPREQLDHINNIRSDNRIANLRVATHIQNQGNQIKPHHENKTGFLGVSFDKRRNKYVAYISINGRNKKLGRFDTPEEAHKKYIEKKREIHEFCTI